MHFSPNLILSGLSSTTLMAMVRMGARGQTANEMSNLFGTFQTTDNIKNGFQNLLAHLKSSQSKECMSVSNNLFVDSRFVVDESYQSRLQSHFGATPMLLDMTNPSGASKSMSNVILKQTGGLINETIMSEDFFDHPVLCLTNSIFFKSEWKHKFKNSKSQFFSVNGNKPGPKMRMNFMNLKDTKFKIVSLDSLAAIGIELPLHNNFSFVILIPENLNGENALHDLEKRLTRTDFSRQLHLENENHFKTKVSVPKFRRESYHNLKSTLQGIGIVRAFQVSILP